MAKKDTPGKSTHEIKSSIGADTISPLSNAFGAYDVGLISPATERQTSRAMPHIESSIINETPDMYQKVAYPYIKSQ